MIYGKTVLEERVRQEMRINESQTAFPSANYGFQVMPNCEFSVGARGRSAGVISALPRWNNACGERHQDVSSWL